MVKKLPANVRDGGSIPGSGRFPREGTENWLQYYCLENPSHGQRSLAGYSPRGISFSIIPSKATHLAANGKFSFLFMAECSIVCVRACLCVCTCSILFSLSTDGHLGYFQILATVNSAAMNIEVHVSFQISGVFSHIYPGVELLGHAVALFLVFRETSTQFSTTIATSYIPTNSVQRVPFPTPSPTFVTCGLFGGSHSDRRHSCFLTGIKESCSLYLY